MGKDKDPSLIPYLNSPGMYLVASLANRKRAFKFLSMGQNFSDT